MGKRGPQPVEIGELVIWEYLWCREFAFLRDGYSSALVVDTGVGKDKSGAYTIRAKRRKRKQVLSRRDLWEALVNRRSAKGIIGICNRWEHWLKSVPREETFLFFPENFSSAPDYLKEHARQFIEAKTATRFPRKRRSADDARFYFLARAMAGISAGVSPATAVDRLGRRKHDAKSNEHRAYCWRCHAEWVRNFRQSELYKAHTQRLLEMAKAQEGENL